MEHFTNIELGKIFDTKNSSGSASDLHWQREGFDVSTIKKLFGSMPSHKFLEDQFTVEKYFNLNGITFGEGLNPNERKNLLYATGLSFHHLSKVLGVDPKSIGFNGNLKLSIGAYGKGGVGNKGARFLQDGKQFIINIDSFNKNTVGALAHAYGTAIDRFLAFAFEEEVEFASGGNSVRKTYYPAVAKSGNTIEKRFEELFKTLYWKGKKETEFHKALDKGATDFEDSRKEVFARVFEMWVARQMKVKNNFLTKPSYKNSNNEWIYPSPAMITKVSHLVKSIVNNAFHVFEEKGLAGVSIGDSGYDGFRKVIKRNGNLQDTLDHIKLVAFRDADQVKGLAQHLEGLTIQETASNIWHYLKANTRYKEDVQGIEEIRTPSRSIHDGRLGLIDGVHGIDCDDYSVLISALLQNVHGGVEHHLRVVSFGEIGRYEHIYPVAFDENGTPFIIDVVDGIPAFNYEKKPITDIIIVPMEIHELSGLGMVDNKSELLEELRSPFTLSGVSEALDDEIIESNFLQGLGEVETEEEAEIILSGSEMLDFLDKGLLAEVAKARKALEDEKNNPTDLSKVVTLEEEIEILDDLLENWHDVDERRNVLLDAIDIKSPFSNFYQSIRFSMDEMEEQEANGALNGAGEIFLARINMDDYEDDLDSLGAVKKRRLRNFFRRVGSNLKKGVKAVIRFSPAVIATRNAALVALKTNVGGLAAKIIYGFLTEAQARAQNLDLTEWRKLTKATKLIEKLFLKLGGKSQNFKNAIIKGRAAIKSGLSLKGLPVLPKIIQTALKLIKGVSQKVLHKFRKKEDKNGDLVDTTTAERNQNVSTREKRPEDGDDPYNDMPSEVDGEVGFVDTAKEHLSEHKWWYLGGVGASVVAIIIWISLKMQKGKKKRSESALQGARTRAVNKALREANPTRRRGGAKSKPKPKSRRKALPVKASSATNKRKSFNGKSTNNKKRFAQAHVIAKKMRKDNPKTKYSVLLGRAHKQLKK